MNRTLVFICCLCYFFGTGNAQDINSKQGYIVTLAGDTISGLVKDKTTLNTVVSFKGTNSSEYTDYSPNEIKSFYFDGGYHYESLSSDEIAQGFFLRVFKGTLSLYQHKDTLYILSPKNEFLELKHHQDKRYVRTLVYLTSDCARTKEKMENVPYTAADISKLLREYEKCVNPEAKLDDGDIARTRLKLGFVAGASISSLNYFVDSKYNLYYEDEFNTQAGYLAGAVLNVSYGKKISVQPGLLIGNRSSTFEGLLYESGSSVKRFVYDTTSISITFLNVPVTAYYTFPMGDLSPYIGLGGSFSMALSDKSTRATVSSLANPFTPDSEYTVVNVDPITSSDLLGVRLAIGVRKQLTPAKEIQFEYTFDSSLMNRALTDDKARWQTHQLTICYMFSLN